MADFIFDGKDFMDKSRKKIAKLDSDSKTIKNHSGSKVGSIDGMTIKNASGSTLAKLDGKVVKNPSGSKIITLDEIHDKIDGLGDTKLVAFYVLFLM